jgi:hypothetical protein
LVIPYFDEMLSCIKTIRKELVLFERENRQQHNKKNKSPIWHAIDNWRGIRNKKKIDEYSHSPEVFFAERPAMLSLLL